MSDRSKWLIGAGLGALALGGLYILNRGSNESSTQSSQSSIERSLPPERENASTESSETVVKSPDSLRMKGNEYYKAKNFKKAAALYQEALEMMREIENGMLGEGDARTETSGITDFEESAQKKATLYNNLSACSERLGQFAEAAVLCLKCLELQNDYKKAWTRLEKIILREKDVKIDLYEHFVILTALSLYKRFKDNELMERAEKALTQLSMETAAQEFNHRVVGSFPTMNYLRLYWRSFTSFSSCEFFTSFQKLVDEQEDLKPTLILLESRAVKSNSPEPSESDSEAETPKVLSVDELTVRGTLYLISANYKLALQDFDRVTKLKDATKSHKCYSQIQIASIFSQMSQAEMAMLHFRQAEQISPKNADVFYHRAQLQLGLGRLDGALSDCKSAVSFDSKHALAASYVGLLEFQKAFQTQGADEQDTAMDAFPSLVSRFPDCAELYALYAQCENMRENYDQAITLYEKCYEVDGSNANALCHMAMILLRIGKAAESIELLSRILREVDENNEFVYETLGSIASQQGDLESAIDSYAKAISCSRNRTEIYQFFARYFTTKSRLECKTRFGLDLP